MFGAILLFLVTSYAPDTDKAEMLAKYGGEQAQFTQMTGGAVVHYRDQGPIDAPVLIMAHGMSSSLHAWEPLIAQMLSLIHI